MTTSGNVSDTIEREIFIAAPIEKVWALVSVPGWWINDGTLDLDTVERLTDDRAVVHHPDAGDLPVERLTAEAPRTATFRWRVSGAEGRRPDAADDQFLYTRISFMLTAEAEGTRLAVTESGFATAAMEETARRRAYTDNSEGWEIELDAARAYLQAPPGASA
ncbi:MAG TPA: SRPBCC domain-containing protein, partial [Trebonia sp.]|jgi:uncharacterized protein YndB with AHSA1/START domain|nr:SRPBCC domain-containing protein [Trebonia sp.]